MAASLLGAQPYDAFGDAPELRGSGGQGRIESGGKGRCSAPDSGPGFMQQSRCIGMLFETFLFGIEGLQVDQAEMVILTSPGAEARHYSFSHQRLNPLFEVCFGLNTKQYPQLLEELL